MCPARPGPAPPPSVAICPSARHVRARPFRSVMPFQCRRSEGGIVAVRAALVLLLPARASTVCRVAIPAGGKKKGPISTAPRGGWSDLSGRESDASHTQRWMRHRLSFRRRQRQQRRAWWLAPVRATNNTWRVFRPQDKHRKRASVGVRIPVAARRLALITSWCLGALGQLVHSLLVCMDGWIIMFQQAIFKKRNACPLAETRFTPYYYGVPATRPRCVRTAPVLNVTVHQPAES